MIFDILLWCFLIAKVLSWYCILTAFKISGLECWKVRSFRLAKSISSFLCYAYAILSSLPKLPMHMLKCFWILASSVISTAFTALPELARPLLWFSCYVQRCPRKSIDLFLSLIYSQFSINSLVSREYGSRTFRLIIRLVLNLNSFIAETFDIGCYSWFSFAASDFWFDCRCADFWSPRWSLALRLLISALPSLWASGPLDPRRPPYWPAIELR